MDDIEDGSDADDDHNAIPEVSGELIARDLEDAVVEDLLKKVECLRLVGEVYTGVVQGS